MSNVVRYPAKPAAGDLRMVIDLIDHELREAEEAASHELTMRAFNRILRRKDALERVRLWLKAQAR